jgi:hypothetical protein
MKGYFTCLRKQLTQKSNQYSINSLQIARNISAPTKLANIGRTMILLFSKPCCYQQNKTKPFVCHQETFILE